MKATKYILIGVFFLAALAIQADDSLNNTDKNAEQNATAKMPVQSAQDLEIEAIKNEVAEFRKIYEKVLDLNAPKKQREQACIEMFVKGTMLLRTLAKIYDPEFDFTIKTTSRVRPPRRPVKKGAVFNGIMSPDNYINPEDKAEYERLIEANNRQKRNRRYQRAIRELTHQVKRSMLQASLDYVFLRANPEFSINDMCAIDPLVYDAATY